MPSLLALPQPKDAQCLLLTFTQPSTRIRLASSIKYNMATTISGYEEGEWTWAYYESDGKISITQGKKTKDTHFLHLIVPCDTELPDYGLKQRLFDSISSTFPSLVCLQVQLDFKGQATSAENLVKFGKWIEEVVEKMVKMAFYNPSDLFLTVTDAVRNQCI